MNGRKTFLGALADFFTGLGSAARHKGWWRTILWLIWFVVVIAGISAVFGSVAEYETSAAWGYAILSVILLAIGLWVAVSGGSRAETS